MAPSLDRTRTTLFRATRNADLFGPGRGRRSAASLSPWRLIRWGLAASTECEEVSGFARVRRVAMIVLLIPRAGCAVLGLTFGMLGLDLSQLIYRDREDDGVAYRLNHAHRDFQRCRHEIFCARLRADRLCFCAAGRRWCTNRSPPERRRDASFWH